MAGGSVVLCTLLMVIFLVVSATIFVVMVSNGTYDVNSLKRDAKNSVRELMRKELHYLKDGEEEDEEDNDNDDDKIDYDNFPIERCPYGFNFLDEDQPAPKRHRLLPANHHQNFSGALFNRELICLDTMDAMDGQWVGFYMCHGEGRNQMMTFSQDGLIVTDGKNLCLSVKNLISDEVILKKCDPLDETQVWTTESYRGWVMPAVKTHYCLTAPEKELDPVSISLCKANSEPQRWQHTIQEVLALWIGGTFHRRRLSSRKLDEGRAKVNKVLLHSQNSMDVDNLFGG